MSENIITTLPAVPQAASSEVSGAKKAWESPVCEELAVQLSAFFPGVGGDGGVNDCSLSI